MTARCERCPVPEDLDCPALTLPHPRYCALLAMGRADYRPLILAMARGEIPGPPPLDAAARRAAKPRVPLGTPHCVPCVQAQAIIQGEETPHGPAN